MGSLDFSGASKSTLLTLLLILLLKLTAAKTEIPPKISARIRNTSVAHKNEDDQGSELKFENITPKPAASPVNKAAMAIEKIVKKSFFFISVTYFVAYTTYSADGVACVAQFLS